MNAIRDFHAHIYFDADQLDRAQKLGAAARERFGVPVGHFTSIRSARTRAEAAS